MTEVGIQVDERLIEPTVLTPASFAPFGEVISPDGVERDYRIESSNSRWTFNFQSGKPRLSLLQTPPMDPVVPVLEAHFHITQTFLPLGGSPAVLVVAPATGRTAPPNPADVQAFILDGTFGYVLSIGTWHSLYRFPIEDANTNWVIINDEETFDDLELALETGTGLHTRIVNLNEAWGYSLKIAA